jgi:hypothetical protein
MFSETERTKIITTMWAIWSSRNSWTHDRGGFNPVQSLKLAKEALAVLALPKKMTAILPGHGWRPPELNVVKINTDGGLSLDAHKGGAGGIARTSSAFLGAWSKPYEGITDPLIAEALSLRDGVILARLRGFMRVIMEVDCLEMVHLWTSRHGARSIVAPILSEIGELSCNFLSFDIKHVPRAANVPAHLCAKQACTLTVTRAWFDSPPDFLVCSLLADQAGSICVV